MIDSTDAAVMERALTWCQGKSILNSINLEDGLERLREGRAAGAALRRRVRGRPDRREGDGGDRRAQARGRAPQLPHPDRGDGCRARGHLVGPAGLPLRHRRRGLPRLGGGDDRGGARRSRREFPFSQDDPRRLERLASACRRPAARCSTRSSSTTHAGRPRRGDRQHRAAGALRRDPGGRAPAGRGADLPAPRRQRGGRGGGGGVHRALPRPRQRQGGGPPRADLPLDERLARAVVEGTKEGLEADLDAALADPRWPTPLERHQRPADGRHGRGRPAVQRQPADRRRGAAVGRGDEGRGLLSRAAHGEGRRARRAARCCSPRSRATCTTSARTWSTSCSRTTASRW